MSFSLRILGTNSPYPEPGRPCSGYLVEAGQTVLLVELGHAVWPELLKNCDPNTIDAVWVSHLHPDHCVDLFAAYQWANNTPGAQRLKVFGPPGWSARLGAALPNDNAAEVLQRVFDVHEHSQALQTIGNVTLEAVPVQHSVPTWGLRVTYRSTSLAYSGDSGPCQALADLAKGSAVFLCEAGADQQSQQFHCTPEEAVNLVGDGPRLVLTHLARTITPEIASQRAHGALVATPGMSIDISGAGKLL